MKNAMSEPFDQGVARELYLDFEERGEPNV